MNLYSFTLSWCLLFSASYLQQLSGIILPTPTSSPSSQEYETMIRKSAIVANKNCESTESIVGDYYWRDYYGLIYNDAVPAGIDKTGKTTYIGQVFQINQGLLPTTIYQGSKSVRTSNNGQTYSSDQFNRINEGGAYQGRNTLRPSNDGHQPYSTDQFIKILCSRHIEKFQWIATSSEESQLLLDCHLVVGGNENGYVANIGRVNHETEIVVGKVFASYAPSKGLTVPTNVGPEAQYQKYEILAYNCTEDKNNSSIFK